MTYKCNIFKWKIFGKFVKINAFAYRANESWFLPWNVLVKTKLDKIYMAQVKLEYTQPSNLRILDLDPVDDWSIFVYLSISCHTVQVFLAFSQCIIYCQSCLHYFDGIKFSKICLDGVEGEERLLLLNQAVQIRHHGW